MLLFSYDGDGNRVWAKDYEGYQASYPGTTLYVGNYYELVSDGRPPEQGTASVCTGAHCIYMPLLFNPPRGISYYYADGQRIAMRSNNTVSWLYGDQLGSVSAVAKADGTLISRSLYYPWGSERLTQGTSPTDYGYTGQMKEDDIYYYNARWYDPQLGRFMQADTIVPLEVQGIQAFDRYAYVNNNPMIYTDPSGHRACDDYYGRSCNVIKDPLPWYKIDGVYSFYGFGWVGEPLAGPMGISSDENVNDPVVYSQNILHQLGGWWSVIGSQLGMHIPVIENNKDINLYWGLTFEVKDRILFLKQFWMTDTILGYKIYKSVVVKSYYNLQELIISHKEQILTDVDPSEYKPCPFTIDFAEPKPLGNPFRVDLIVDVFCGYCLFDRPMWKGLEFRIK